MLTDTLTGLLLAFGAILVAFAVAGFAGNWTSRPDHDSLAQGAGQRAAAGKT